MNYGFLDIHNYLIASGRVDLAAKNLNEINRLALDPLTGLQKKEFLKRKLQRFGNEVYQCQSDDFALVMCDIDHFKKVNDTYGHAVGDDTLTLFGRILSKGLRPCDVAYRYGGEEFLIILPNTNLEGALAAAERMRLLIHNTLKLGHYGLNHIAAYQLDDSELTLETTDEDMNNTFFLAQKISCSFGVASYTECEYSSELLFQRADKCLYSAKKSGRNCVAFE